MRIFLLISLGIHALLLGYWQNSHEPAVSASHASSRIQLALIPEQENTRDKNPAKQIRPEKSNKQPVSKKQNKYKIVAVTKKSSAQEKHEQNKPAHVLTKTQVSQPEISEANNQLISERIQKQLNIKLGFNRQYPVIAIRNAWQGRVNLGIRIQANGRLTHVRIIKSSGYNILDNAAITSVHNVASLPEAVYWLDGNYIDVILPVIYKLTES